MCNINKIIAYSIISKSYNYLTLLPNHCHSAPDNANAEAVLPFLNGPD